MSTEPDSSSKRAEAEWSNVSRPVKQLSPETEAWSKAALDAGNRADRDPIYATEVGKRLF